MSTIPLETKPEELWQQIAETPRDEKALATIQERRLAAFAPDGCEGECGMTAIRKQTIKVLEALDEKEGAYLHKDWDFHGDKYFLVTKDHKTPIPVRVGEFLIRQRYVIQSNRPYIFVVHYRITQMGRAALRGAKE